MYLIKKLKSNFKSQKAPWLVLFIWLVFFLLYYSVIQNILLLMFVGYFILVVINICFAVFI